MLWRLASAAESDEIESEEGYERFLKGKSWQYSFVLWYAMGGAIKCAAGAATGGLWKGLLYST